MSKLSILLLLLIYSCRTTKSTSTKSDPNWDKMMDTVINETIQKLKDSGYIK